MKNNLLNNQNYILWKTEKKKLLSKFFVEKNIQSFYKILDGFYNITLRVFVFVWVIIFTFSAIWGILYHNNDDDLIGKVIWIVFQLGILYGFYFFRKEIFYTKIFCVKSLKDFVFRKNQFQISQTVFNILKMWLSMLFKERDFNIWSPKSPTHLLQNIFYVLFVPLILGLFVFLFLDTHIIAQIIIYIILIIIFDVISLVWTLLLPLLVITIWVSFLFTIISMFLLWWVRKLYFLKYSPQTKILKKFSQLESNYAKNNYYKIELKK